MRTLMELTTVLETERVYTQETINSIVSLLYHKLSNKEFMECDSFIAEVDIQNTTTESLLAIATITLSWDKELMHRGYFVDNVYNELMDRYSKDKVKTLMRGLR